MQDTGVYGIGTLVADELTWSEERSGVIVLEVGSPDALDCSVLDVYSEGLFEAADQNAWEYSAYADENVDPEIADFALPADLYSPTPTPSKFLEMLESYTIPVMPIDEDGIKVWADKLSKEIADSRHPD